MDTAKLQQRQQTLINLITRVGGRQNIQKWVDELLKIDLELEKAGDKKMTSIEYKSFKLTANAVTYKGKKLPQERWSLSRGLGVILLAEGGNDFSPVLDLSHIRLTANEEKEYQQKLVIQKTLEESFANNEWIFKRSTSVEQDIYGNRVTAYDRWEHPIYGIVEGEQWHVPSQYSADNWKNFVLLSRKSAESRRLIFQAWVDYWAKIDIQPKKDPMAAANAIATELEALGVMSSSIIIEQDKVTVRGADAQTHGGKEYFFDVVVWHNYKGSKLEISSSQVAASKRALEAKEAKTAKTVVKGQKVIHATLGQGEVVMVFSPTICSVRFAGVGNTIVDPSALSLA